MLMYMCSYLPVHMYVHFGVYSYPILHYKQFSNIFPTNLLKCFQWSWSKRKNSLMFELFLNCLNSNSRQRPQIMGWKPPLPHLPPPHAHTTLWKLGWILLLGVVWTISQLHLLFQIWFWRFSTSASKAGVFCPWRLFAALCCCITRMLQRWGGRSGPLRTWAGFCGPARPGPAPQKPPGILPRNFIILEGKIPERTVNKLS